LEKAKADLWLAAEN